VGGPDAIGGVDDWAFGNGTLCGVVSDPSHENDISVTGGALVDLGHCGRDDDQFLILEQLLNLSISNLVPVTNVRPTADATSARIVTRGEREGLVLETTFALDLEQPTRLRVVSRLTRSAEGASVFGVGVTSANVEALKPFVLSTRNTAWSSGFVHVPFFGEGAGAAGRAAVPMDVAVAVGDSAIEPGIAYGARLLSARLERASGERVEVPSFILADDMASVLAVFVRPFWIGDGTSLGWLQFLQTRFMDLSVGDTLVVEQELWVGERSDVASVTSQLFADEPLVFGRVDDATARIHIDLADQTPFTEVRPDNDGSFRLRLPSGEYRLRALAAGRREVERSFQLRDEELDLGTVELGPAARVRLPQGSPMRLVFLGQDGTPDPRFGDELLGFTLVGRDESRQSAGVRYVPLSGGAEDPAWVVVPPGRYRVLATRGPEFSVTEANFVVGAGETVTLDIEPPRREFETPGWISSDFHVHASPSLDTGLPLRTRVASYIAEGAEVLISSDHDMVTDYGPLIAELGLEEELVGMVGVEVTSEVKTQLAPHTIGHANAFPVPLQPTAYRRGAVPNEGRRWREIIADLRGLAGERVIQLNHPRHPGGVMHPRDLFTHLAYVGKPFDPTRPLSEPPNHVLIERDPETGLRDIDFDAMELLNGEQMDAYSEVRDDWFSLLRQGVVLAGTANSDSHTLQSPVAAPRNYVRVSLDSLRALDADEFVRSIRAQHTFGTTGPLVDVELGGAGPGDRFSGSRGTIRIRVRAARWVPVSEARVFVNGVRTYSGSVSSGGVVAVPQEFSRDSFVTVEVDGSPDDLYAAVLPGFAPFAFTNPIFVDADGDGAWAPPGLE
jgi:hypothetical protein